LRSFSVPLSPEAAMKTFYMAPGYHLDVALRRFDERVVVKAGVAAHGLETDAVV
jgi:hypothetical protein